MRTLLSMCSAATLRHIDTYLKLLIMSPSSQGQSKEVLQWHITINVPSVFTVKHNVMKAVCLGNLDMPFMAEHPQRGQIFKSKLLDCTGFSYVRHSSIISNSHLLPDKH